MLASGTRGRPSGSRCRSGLRSVVMVSLHRLACSQDGFRTSDHGGGQGKPDNHLGPPARDAQHLDLAAMAPDDLLDDGEPEARALSPTLGGKERLEHVIQLL